MPNPNDEGAETVTIPVLRPEDLYYAPGPSIWSGPPEELPIAETPRYRCACHSCTLGRGERCECERCQIRRDVVVTRECYQCGEEFNVPRYNDYGEYCSQSCYDVAYGYDDDDDDFRDGFVHNYSYRPPCNFRTAPDETDAKLFFGVELEVPTDYSEEVAEQLHNGAGDEERLLYCKEDGSIDGVEIVSHPMTHKFFRESFPFELFNRRKNPGRLLRYNTPPEGYGLHVHVSRAGFKDEAHILRWLLLIYRNQESMEALARRSASSWANFQDYGRCYEKARNITRDSYGDVYPQYEGERYVAVNATNRDTFELRMFRSTWKEQQFRAAVDFAHASVKYAEELTGADVTNGNGLSFGRFREWLADKDEYTALRDELAQVLPEVATGEYELTEEEEELLCAC